MSELSLEAQRTRDRVLLQNWTCLMLGIAAEHAVPSLTPEPEGPDDEGDEPGGEGDEEEPRL